MELSGHTFCKEPTREDCITRLTLINQQPEAVVVNNNVGAQVFTNKAYSAFVNSRACWEVKENEELGKAESFVYWCLTHTGLMYQAYLLFVAADWDGVLLGGWESVMFKPSGLKVEQ